MMPTTAITTTDPHLIRLAPDDNVVVLATTVAAGAVLEVLGEPVTLTTNLTLGHKIAARDIAKGETIMKYAFPIGVATVDIPKGAHVHLHNVASRYTASYVVEET